MRVADFFCGGGGFSEGFRQAGFEIVFAVDKWEPAVTTYHENKSNSHSCSEKCDGLPHLGNNELIEPCFQEPFPEKRPT